jgi:hypothetical protein
MYLCSKLVLCLFEAEAADDFYKGKCGIRPSTGHEGPEGQQTYR